MYTKNYDQTCREINWTELSAQKQTLMKIKESLPKSKDRKNIDNLIMLIDKLQDAATDVHNVSLNKVYPSLDNVRLLTTSKRSLVII